MAAKNKKTARRGATEREPDVQNLVGLHLTASQNRDALRAAQEIRHRVTALETEVRLNARGPQDA
jgi:putative hemolysin